jgi:hypothetical protein
VFTTPLTVTPKMEQRKTPGNYRRFPGGKDLLATLAAWRVQTLPARTNHGAVARSYGFEDSPDAEILAPGLNHGKESGAVGVGRHGNFLQWGYSGTPDQMTASARSFFLNCICYIRKYDGMPPLVKRQGSPRMNALRLAGLVDAKFRDGNDWVLNSFRPGLARQYEGRAEEFAALFQENLELIYRADGKYLIDAELQALGIASNRRLETLDKLIDLLEKPETTAAARVLLARYTERGTDSPGVLREWVGANRDRIYFSDWAGYKFRAMPRGYLSRPGWKAE